MNTERLGRVRELAPLLAGGLPWMALAFGVLASLFTSGEREGLAVMSSSTFTIVLGVWAGAAISVGSFLVCLGRLVAGPRDRWLWFGFALCLAYQLPLLFLLLRQSDAHG